MQYDILNKETNDLKKLYEDFFDEIADEEMANSEPFDDSLLDDYTSDGNLKLRIQINSFPPAIRKDQNLFMNYLKQVDDKIQYVLKNALFIESFGDIFYAISTDYNYRSSVYDSHILNGLDIRMINNDKIPSYWKKHTFQTDSSQILYCLTIKCNLKKFSEVIKFVKMFCETIPNQFTNTFGKTRFWSIDFFNKDDKRLYSFSVNGYKNVMAKKDDRSTKNHLMKLKKILSDKLSKKSDDVKEYFGKRLSHEPSAESLDIMKNLGISIENCISVFEDGETLFIETKKDFKYKSPYIAYTVNRLKEQLKNNKNIKYLLITCNGPITLRVYGDYTDKLNEFLKYFYPNFDKLTLDLTIYIPSYNNKKTVTPIDISGLHINELVCKIHKSWGPDKIYFPQIRFNTTDKPKKAKFLAYYKHDSRTGEDVSELYRI